MNFIRAFSVRGKSKRIYTPTLNRVSRERLNQARSWVQSMRSQHDRDMPSYTIHFDDNDTTPSRLQAFAKELDISVDDLIHRAISQHLGMYGTQPVDIGKEPTNLQEFFVANGLLKNPLG